MSHAADQTETDTYEVAVLLCSRINGHWGLILYPNKASDGRLFHVRNTDSYDSDKFFYDERDQPLDMDGVFGRSVIGTISSAERPCMEKVIRDYASIDENIPRFSEGRNCQTFVTEVIGQLEVAGLLRPVGHKRYFEGQHRRKGTDIAASLQGDGRSWIERVVYDTGLPADAKYTTPERVPPPRRKLDTEAFEGLLKPRLSTDAADGSAVR